MTTPKLGPPLVLPPKTRAFVAGETAAARAVLAAAPAVALVRLAGVSPRKHSPGSLFVAYGAPSGLPEADDAFAAAAWRFERRASASIIRWVMTAQNAAAVDLVFTRARTWALRAETAPAGAGKPLFRALAIGDSAHQRLQDIQDFAAFLPLIEAPSIQTLRETADGGAYGAYLPELVQPQGD